MERSARRPSPQAGRVPPCSTRTERRAVEHATHRTSFAQWAVWSNLRSYGRRANTQRQSRLEDTDSSWFRVKPYYCDKEKRQCFLHLSCSQSLNDITLFNA